MSVCACMVRQYSLWVASSQISLKKSCLLDRGWSVGDRAHPDRSCDASPVGAGLTSYGKYGQRGGAKGHNLVIGNGHMGHSQEFFSLGAHQVEQKQAFSDTSRASSSTKLSAFGFRSSSLSQLQAPTRRPTRTSWDQILHPAWYISQSVLTCEGANLFIL